MDYVFASSRIRSAEKNLLTREKADKMIDSKRPEDALKILLELNYGTEESRESATFAQVDEILAHELAKAYEFVIDIAPEKEAFNTFLYPYDYHNLKVIMKAEFSGVEEDAFLIEIGTIPKEKLVVMVRERNLTAMPETMKNAVLEVIDAFARTKDPQTVDMIFDRACYEAMLCEAEKSGSDFVKDYVKLLIDTINLKTFARLREMGRGWDFFGKIFLKGGKIPEKLFVGGYDESYEQFAERLSPYGFTQVVTEGGAAVKETGRFTVLEKCCDNKIMEFAEKAKYISFGIEPLVAYLIAKEGEIRLARIILAGLSQGLAREQMEERMRKTYV